MVSADMSNQHNDLEPPWGSQYGGAWARRFDHANAASRRRRGAPRLERHNVCRDRDWRRSHTKDVESELACAWLLQRHRRQPLFEKPATNVGHPIEFMVWADQAGELDGAADTARPRVRH